MNLAIPLGRPTVRLKYLLERNDSGVWGDDPVDNRGTVVLRSTDQTVDGKWKIVDPAIRQLTDSEATATILVDGDLVVTKSSGSARHIGKTTLVDATVAAMDASFGNFMQRLRGKDGTDPRFLWYLLNHEFVRRQFCDLSTTSTGLSNLTGRVIGEVELPFLEVAEQRAVADYLDRETARIDTLIEEQKRLIEMLRERRGAVADQLLNPPGCQRPLKLFVAEVTVGIVVNPSAWYAPEGVPALRGLNVQPER
jgi:type I restriction enzyme S subunit